MLSSPSRLGSREGKPLTYLDPAAALWLMTGFPEADAHAKEGEDDSGEYHGAGREQEEQQKGTQQQKGRQGDS